MIAEIALTNIPLRIDLAGGWLDVPKYSREDGYVINLTIQPFESYPGGGLGGSAKYALEQNKNPKETEPAGWQDYAIIQETGICVWQSGKEPKLLLKRNIDWLPEFWLYWTGIEHSTRDIINLPRDYDGIAKASRLAAQGVEFQDTNLLAKAMNHTYVMQRMEGMKPLPYRGQRAAKYCGSGFGGYAVYMNPEDKQDLIKVTPYIRNY